MIMSYFAMPGVRERALTYRTDKAERIISIVCNRFGIKESDIRMFNRRKRYVEPRQIAIYLIKRRTMLSLKDIGELMGGRDHTTSLHSINVVKDHMDTEPAFRNIVHEIEGLI